MEKDIIKNISIEDFKTNKNFVDYIDDDFLVANSLENIPYSNDAVRLNCFLLISCIEGCIQLDMNNKTYQLQNNDIIFGLPSVIISHIMLSPKHKISILGFSTHFLQRIFKIGKDTFGLCIAIHIAEKRRRERIRTIFISDGVLYNPEVGVVRLESNDPQAYVDGMRELLDNLNYDPNVSPDAS